MLRRTALIVAVLVLGLLMTWQSEATSSPEWVYRWELGADGSTKLWRQRVDANDEEWVAAGSVDREVVDVATTPAQADMAVMLTKPAPARNAGPALFRTQDGMSWEELPSLPDWPMAIALGQEKAGLIYLGTLTGGVYRSDDGGHTWQQKPFGVPMLSGPFLEATAVAIHPQDDDIVYAAAGFRLGSTQMEFSPGGIAMSFDGGESWLVVHEAELGEERIIGLEPDPENPRRVLGRTERSAKWYVLPEDAPPTVF